MSEQDQMLKLLLKWLEGGDEGLVTWQYQTKKWRAREHEGEREGEKG